MGESAVKALGLDDVVFEYEITSNRVDCYGVLGIAREAAATFQKKFCPPIVEVKENDEKWYPDKDYHTMYLGEIVKVLVRE